MEDRLIHSLRVPFVTLCWTIILVFGPANSTSSVIEKMTPEELVAKHLESIGSSQARNARHFGNRPGHFSYGARWTGGG